MWTGTNGTVELYFLESEDFKESIKIGHFVAERRGMVKKKSEFTKFVGPDEKLPLSRPQTRRVFGQI